MAVATVKKLKKEKGVGLESRRIHKRESSKQNKQVHSEKVKEGQNGNMNNQTAERKRENLEQRCSRRRVWGRRRRRE